jgi:hypothetical protein
MITMSRDDLQQATTDERWRAIAALHADEAALDDASRRLIMTENPTAVAAAAVAETKRRVEMSAIARIFANLQSSVAIDTVRNEYELHTQIHQWYLNGDVGPDITDLNRRVYADLFLMPDSDPWLGLGAPDAYTGIRNAGVVAAE